MALRKFCGEDVVKMKKFKVGDIVFVSDPDECYEAEYGIREHRSFFGRVTEISECSDELCVTVKFPATPNGYAAEGSYDGRELSLAEKLKDMTLEEFSNKYGVTVMAEYLL